MWDALFNVPLAGTTLGDHNLVFGGQVIENKLVDVNPGARDNVAATFDVWQLVALAAALGWAAGIRLYAVLFIVGAAGSLGWVPLPPGLEVLALLLVLAAWFCFSVVVVVGDNPQVDVQNTWVARTIYLPSFALVALLMGVGWAILWNGIAGRARQSRGASTDTGKPST